MRHNEAYKLFRKKILMNCMNVQMGKKRSVIFEFVNFIKKIKIKHINMLILKLYYTCMWIYEENHLFYLQSRN